MSTQSPDQAGMQTESVWDYLRPPAVRPCTQRVQVFFAVVEAASTTNAPHAFKGGNGARGW